MIAGEPRVRRRGFFLHSSDNSESDMGYGNELENPEGITVRVRVARPSVPRPAATSGRSRTSSRHGKHRAGNQIRERDWQPSTGTLAPLIQLARGETRNATTAPTSSGRPNRPNGSSRLTKSAIPSGSSCTADPRSPGNRIEPGATLFTRMLSRGQLLRHRLRQADFGGLHGVVGHPAARLPAPDRRDHDDRRRRRGGACAERPAVTRGWRETASDRTLPATPHRDVSTMPAPLARPTLFTRMSRPPNVSTVRATTSATPFRSRQVCLDRQDPLGPAGHRAQLRRRLGEARFAAGADRHTATLVEQAPSRSPGPDPALEPVTMAILCGEFRSRFHRCALATCLPGR